MSLLRYFVIFFFMQEMAYMLRISDWSTDECSTDLDRPARYRCDEIGDGLGRLLALQAIVLAQSGFYLGRALELRRIVEMFVFDLVDEPQGFDRGVLVPELPVRPLADQLPASGRAAGFGLMVRVIPHPSAPVRKSTRLYSSH